MRIASLFLGICSQEKFSKKFFEKIKILRRFGVRKTASVPLLGLFSSPGFSENEIFKEKNFSSNFHLKGSHLENII